ncbi:SusC/RagA family TonB-linked outer membrane protein [Asinibacterium sp. OR53]|uniref:SusC/RagA family TonB-linked outer membrane protein n=1 Tax=Asinibacterium sp. OR53 TaxID=925409 RepID=UPI0004799DF1|nr:SusC/RagA family TonB-linked outer membrane protein [Asinibacterium sp. OR53]
MRKKMLLSVCSLFMTLLVSLAQTATITGKVVDDKGAPIPGATILERGSKNGTSATNEGDFVIKVKKGATLLITALGFENREVVASSSPLSITLTADVRSLSEVVVTGVGVATSKKKLAISVESITADKLPSTPSGSIDQALVGKIAGAQISTTSGNPGQAVSIQLRGMNTIQGGTQPMILVDGVEMAASSLGTLDLNSIERVEVVQGAASATIYGAQGANGVIQIFTKKGKPGAAKIDVSSRVSWDSYINVGNMHQPVNHSFQVDNNGDVVQSDGSGGFVPLKRNALGIWGNPIWLAGPNDQNNKPYKDNTKYYDHIKQLFRTAMTTNHSVFLSGGKEKSDYAIGLSQLTQQSIIDGELKRTNLTLNFGFELFKNFKVRAINQLVYTTNSTGNNNISAALYTYPIGDFTFKDPDGNSPFKFGQGIGANSSNPYYYRQYRKFDDRQLDIIPSINLSYKFPRFLDLDYKFSINQNRDDYTRTDANQTGNKSSAAYGFSIGAGGVSGTIDNNIARYTTQNSIATAILKFDFDKDFNMKKLPIIATTTAAYDWRQKRYNITSLEYTGLPTFPANANQAATKSILNVYEDNFITYGLFVNQKLEWADIAGVSGGMRSDYSSTFGSGQKAQTFPRGDAYLRLSSMDFWNNGIGKVIPEFKIRAAYGEAGIQPGVFDRISTLNNFSVDNGPSFYNPSQVANPALTVERSKETEVGVDMNFKIGKQSWLPFITASATYWNRKGSDIIWSIPLAISSGASTLKSNVLDLSSSGFQFSVDAAMYKSKNFNWNLLTIFGTQKTFTDKITGTPDIPLVYSSAATYTLRAGEQFGTIYGYKALTSVDQTDVKGKRYIDKSLVGNYEMVDGRVVEKAGKKVMFTSDKYVLGNTTPKFTMSFTNTLTFKDYLTLSFQLDWVAQALQYNQTKEWMYSEGLHGDFDKPVTINGQTGAWTAYYKSFYDASESNGTKDYFLENSSFLRLRNVALSFDVAKLTRIKFTNRLQVVLSGRNIWTSTKYTGMDPEANVNTNGGGSTGAAQTSVQKGLDYFSFPNTKSYQIGINIGLN